MQEDTTPSPRRDEFNATPDSIPARKPRSASPGSLDSDIPVDDVAPPSRLRSSQPELRGVPLRSRGSRSVDPLNGRDTEEILLPESDADDFGLPHSVREKRLVRPRAVTRTIVETRLEPLSAEEAEEQQKLAEATGLLHSSRDEAVRQKATDTIHEQLNAQFDRDLKRREQELADIEARLKALREQVDRRKAARDRIVELRLNTIINEADGLGFPADTAGRPDDDPFGSANEIPLGIPSEDEDLMLPKIVNPSREEDFGRPTSPPSDSALPGNSR